MKAVQGVAQVTEQSAAGSEDAGAQAGATKDLVGQFRTSDSRSRNQAELARA